jgi:transposase
MNAYSLDLRERVVAAVTAGTSQAEVVRVFQISQSTLTRYHKQHRTTHTLVPRPHGGGPLLAIPASNHQALADLVGTDADATLAQLCDAWAEQTGVRVSQATMCRTLATIGLPRKKRV